MSLVPEFDFRATISPHHLMIVFTCDFEDRHGSLRTLRGEDVSAGAGSDDEFIGANSGMKFKVRGLEET